MKASQCRYLDKRRTTAFSRRRPLASTTDLIDQLSHGTGPADTAGLIVAWIERIIWHMSSMMDDLEDRASHLEDSLLSKLLHETAHLRKQTIAIKRYLAPQREALNRLYIEALPWLNDTLRVRLREAADKLIRHTEDIDSVRERLAMAQDELSNRVAEQMNERSFVPTVVAVIFLPLGFSPV